jgi:CTP:molybdopterin cytidylyltransferase MocA
VITGADHDEIAAAAQPGAEIGFNPDWRAGRSGGVLLAGRLRPDRDLCIAPVDVPLVPSAVFEALLTAWMAADSPDRGWLAPCHTPRSLHPGGSGPRFGHPIVIGRKLLRDLAEGGPATPLHVLRERAKPLLSVEVDHPEVLDDLDSPEDFQRLRIRSRG